MISSKMIYPKHQHSLEQNSLPGQNKPLSQTAFAAAVRKWVEDGYARVKRVRFIGGARRLCGTHRFEHVGTMPDGLQCFAKDSSNLLLTRTDRRLVY